MIASNSVRARATTAVVVRQASTSRGFISCALCYRYQP
jgi:hypothetical protein